MALSFNVKDIDYKKFFLERGEWVGLAVILLIAVPVFGTGVKSAISSGSASTNAKEVGDLAKTLDQRIQSSPVPQGAEDPPPESDLKVDTSLVDSANFVTPRPWFIQSTIEDTKRRKPEILNPSDFMTSVIRFGALGYKTQFENGKMYMLVVTERESTASPATKKQQKRIQDLQKALASRGAGGGGMMGGMMRGMMGAGGAGGGKMGGGGMGGMPGAMGGQSLTQQMMGGGMPGMMRGMGMPGMGMAGRGPGAGRMVREAKFQEVEKIKADQTTQIAEELYTGRMVLVQAAFPAKEQLELFRVALRKQSLADMVPLIDTDEFRFVNLDVQRRELSADGRPASNWEDYDKRMKQELGRLLAISVEVDQPDAKLVEYAMIPKRGLCWPLPRLELPYGEPEQSRYPKPTDIASIKESLEKLEKVAQDTNQKPPNELVQRIRGEFDLTDPFGTTKEQDTASQEQPKPASGGEDKDKEKNADPNAAPEPVLPDKVLVRFADLTVVPGHTYEYRVRVRAANPNYKQKSNLAYAKLASDPEVTASDWAVVPKVTVPYDVNWYAMDKRGGDRDQTVLQIQDWVDVVNPDPKNPKDLRKVGDWAIWDNARFYRGEYIGRVSNVQLPAWSIEKDDFEMAHVSGRQPSLSSTVPVDFTVRQGNARSPALLVDFGGGTLQEKLDTRNIKDDAPIQVLVLNPDGQLEMRTSEDDVKDPVRKDRFDTWKKRLTEIKQGGGRRQQQQPGMPGGDLFNKAGKNG
jgi:hypothetical protein